MLWPVSCFAAAVRHLFVNLKLSLLEKSRNISCKSTSLISRKTRCKLECLFQETDPADRQCLLKKKKKKDKYSFFDKCLSFSCFKKGSVSIRVTSKAVQPLRTVLPETCKRSNWWLINSSNRKHGLLKLHWEKFPKLRTDLWPL